MINEESVSFKNERIESWINGYERFPLFWENVKYLKKSKTTKDIFEKLDRNELLKNIKDKLNDHMHFNSFHFLLMNDDGISYPQRTEYIDKLLLYLDEIFSIHFFTMFTINEHYMRSVDYTDSLEVGDNPDLESLFWVAPFVQSVIDEYIKCGHPEVFNYFRKKSKMKIE